ncbi:MAG: DNA polymerase I [Candidatus Saccharimonadales bacterium]
MASDKERKKLAVIDGKSVFYRGYYAMPNLSTKDGTPTGGVFGFATMALEVIRRLKPDYVAVAWDKPKTNIRKRLEIYPEYKAGRKPAPPDFYEQIPLLHELLDAFGWPLYELDDYEADDIMGTLAVQAKDKNLDTMLITSDLDMLQLVNGHVKVYALKKGLSNIELYSPESFTAKYGIDVDQFLDLKALKGDSSDNIPGVPGIGEKTAVQLLQEHQTLDGIYENLVLLKDSVRKKLEAGKDSAYMSKKLGAIWCDAPLPIDLEAMDGHNIDPQRLLALLEKFEFRSLARQLPSLMQVAVDAHVDAKATATGKHKSLDVVVVRTEAEAEGISLPETIVLQARCAGPHGRDANYFVAHAPSTKIVYVLDVKALGEDTIIALLGGVKHVIGYDVKSSLQALLDVGVTELPAVSHDVLVGAFLIDSLRREQSLMALATEDVGYEGSELSNLDDEEFVTKAGDIVAAIDALYAQQHKALVALPEIEKLAHDVEWPVIPVIAHMEYRGIQLDTDYLANFADEISDMISDLEQEIYGYADKEFNIASPAQMALVLFETLQLPTQGIKKGKTGYSTAASELDKLRHAHPIIDLITKFREVTKLKNTYVDTLPKMVDGHNRLHTTFNLTIAQTGRLSSNDPNLQNIPVRTELGKHIRTAFVAGKGKRLVSADYSQFELRLAAAMSEDADMIAMFNRGADIHLTTAAEVYGRSPEDVTKQMRSAAKTINFGVLYGMSPHGLAAATGMTFAQAKTFIDEYFKLRAPLLGYLDGLKDKARKDGYVQTLLGRRRPMPDIHSSNFIVRQAAERAAMNMPIQGTEADLMKLAMVAVDEAFAKDDTWKDAPEEKRPHQLLQIHDSILVECEEDDAEKVAHILKTTMEAIYPELPVKLDVDTSIGTNWGEL